MECFIKRVIDEKIDEKTHHQFVRFGKGHYKNRMILSFHKTASKIKVKGSFEYANDFTKLATELGDFDFFGVLLSKEELSELGAGKKKAGTYQYEFNGNSEKVKEISEKVYMMLLNIKSDKLKLRIKKKLPKPGKAEDKIDDKFCLLEADNSYWPQIKKAFFWDLPECKKAKINFEVIINEIVMPEGEKDFAKIREIAKRKGRLIKNTNIDGKESSKEFDFEA